MNISPRSILYTLEMGAPLILEKMNRATAIRARGSRAAGGIAICALLGAAAYYASTQGLFERFSTPERRLELAWKAFEAGDDASAYKRFRALAEEGNASAQQTLGELHAKGRGGAKLDYGAARHWLRLAAEKERSGAQVNLGAMFFKGYGGPVDMRAASYWFGRAAAQGDAYGKQYLAVVEDLRRQADEEQAATAQTSQPPETSGTPPELDYWPVDFPINPVVAKQSTLLDAVGAVLNINENISVEEAEAFAQRTQLPCDRVIFSGPVGASFSEAYALGVANRGENPKLSLDVQRAIEKGFTCRPAFPGGYWCMGVAYLSNGEGTPLKYPITGNARKYGPLYPLYVPINTSMSFDRGAANVTVFVERQNLRCTGPSVQ